MAINLSRSVTRPCDILCDLTIDDVAISGGSVAVSGGQAVMLQFDDQQPSLKFNGQGYTCIGMLIRGPSWHTIEDIRADAECVAVAQNPKGDILCMSVLLRTNTASSPINTSIHGWLPYAVDGNKISLKLGEEWSLTKMIPTDPAYFVYKGSMPWSPDSKVQWVVFRTMGNIDPNDFALLTKLIPAVPTRINTTSAEIFFNETSHIAGVPDGKAYMRCRRIKKKDDESATRVTPVAGLATTAAASAAQAESQTSTLSWIQEVTYGYIVHAGAGNVLDAVVFAIAIIAGLIAAYSISSSPRGLSLAKASQTGAKGLLRFWNGMIDRMTLIPFMSYFRYTGSL